MRRVPAEAGAATVSELARHWAVSAGTARAIVAEAGLTPVGAGRRRYMWFDVWRLEGAPFVPPAEWPDYRAPLLRVPDLVHHDAYGRAARTLRRHVAAGRIPSIRLSAGVRRIRPREFELAQHHV